MSGKLSAAQQQMMDRVDGKPGLVTRREKDGTLMPYKSEAKTVAALVRRGLLKWVHVGQDGYHYNGVVRAKP